MAPSAFLPTFAMTFSAFCLASSRASVPTLGASLRGWLRAGALAACLCAGQGAGAGPVPWPDAPYSYFANNTRLEAVLAEFASSFSLSLALQPGVSGTVNGRFTAKNPTEFIARLGGVYGFAWYTHAGTLHVSRASDTVTRSLTVPGGSLNNLRQALTDLGVLEPRFGWGELGDQGVVMVSGPPSYVALVESTLRELPPAAGAQQVAVFRLRHASAEDRLIRYRDREITQVGLATVLKDLIANRGGTRGNNEMLSAVSPGLRPAAALATEAATGVPGAASTSAAPATGQPAAAAAGGAPTRSATGGDVRVRQPSIQSDPRLNAIIVQDIPERIPLYEKLIAQLDVPTALIEIEAMIIDINSERARDLGINWAGRGGRTAAGFGALTQQPSEGTLSIVRGPAGTAVSSSTLVVDAGNYLINQIRLLENHGDARIQSRPSVLTTDNTGALLDLSETFYVRLQGERVVSVTPVTAGTTLRVTPRLIDGSEPAIQLMVDIEDGQIQDRQIDALPTVRRSAVSTQAIVRQNETLLIAGHSTDQSIESDRRVPVLGEIPGLGLLFSNKLRSVQKRERLFMIRPKLVSMPGVASAAAAPQ